eukprot:3488827-Prymnesium_polylepis.1
MPLTGAHAVRQPRRVQRHVDIAVPRDATTKGEAAVRWGVGRHGHKAVQIRLVDCSSTGSQDR